MTTESADSPRHRRRQEHLARDSGEGLQSLPDSHRSIWIDARKEFDKQLLALSSSGVGLLIALAKSLAPMSLAATLSFSTSIISFLGCSLTMLLLLRINADYVEIDAGGMADEQRKLSKRLRLLDRAAVSFFAFGIFSAAILGLISALTEGQAS